MFTVEELNKAKELAYINWENNGDIGFEYKGQWITNPFLDDTGRFEFTDFSAMCEYYGTDNVATFIREILEKRANTGNISREVQDVGLGVSK